MSSRLNILLDALGCKAKTCPVCKTGEITENGETDNPVYSCSNPECMIKNCGELWMMKLFRNTELLKAAELTSELFGRMNNTFLHFLEVFKSEIESGILREMDELGMPCSEMKEQVIGMIGRTSDAQNLESTVRFIYSDGSNLTAYETPRGKIQHGKCTRAGGCFPYKTPKIEKTIYVFPSAKSVLKARHIWNSAGLGDFPAYSLAGIPLPTTFCGTEKIIFANIDGKMASPDLLAEAMDRYKKGVHIAKQTSLDLFGLRSLYLYDNPERFEEFRKAEGLLEIGKTEKDKKIYFSKEGYRIENLAYGLPSKKTNFAFDAKKIYLFSYPEQNKAVFGDLYVNGKLIRRNMFVGSHKKNYFREMQNTAIASTSETIWTDNLKEFSNATFSFPEAESIHMPLEAGVYGNNEVAFPRFRISNGQIKPHPELVGMFERKECNQNYMGFFPEHATLGDMSVLAGFFANRNPANEIATIGICAWMYMLLTAMVENVCENKLPKLCFEIHSQDSNRPKEIEFLFQLFSGNKMQTYKVHRLRPDMLSMKAIRAWNETNKFSPLPRLIETNMTDKQQVLQMNYGRTKMVGMYSVLNSELVFPMNGYGNIQCAVESSGKDVMAANIPALRRSLLYFLAKFNKLAKTLDPEEWPVKNPENYIYKMMTGPLKHLGMAIPDSSRFSDYYLAAQ